MGLSVEHGRKGSQPDKAQGAQGVVTMFGILYPVAYGAPAAHIETGIGL